MGDRPCFEHHDRALINSNWDEDFYATKIQHLSRSGSDHSPLLIATDIFVPNVTHKTFGFLKMCINHSQFMEAVQTTWSVDVHGNGMHILLGKLKAVKKALNEWNRQCFVVFLTLWKRVKKRCFEQKICTNHTLPKHYK
jgi:hypothetical protein